MGNPKIPTFFPRQKRNVKGFLANANLRIAPPPAGDGLGTKYTLDAAKIARLILLAGDIDSHLVQAEQLRNQAQQQTDLADAGIKEANSITKEFSESIQKHASFDRADLEQLGYEVLHEDDDPNTAKVVITHITPLVDGIRFDYAKEGWFGIRIYGSYDDNKYDFLDKDDRSRWEDKRFNKVYGVPENRYFIFRHVDKDGKEIGVETRVVYVAAIYDIQGGRPVAN